MAHNDVVSSPKMGRKPGKPKKGELYRMHVALPGELVLEIDQVVEQLRAADPLRSPSDVGRTYALRVLVTEALKARKGSK